MTNLIENSDAARRISDTVSLHLVATTDIMENIGKWCAFRLSDGTSDQTAYDTKDDAIRHQKGDPNQYCYLKITPDGISPKDAWHFLRTNRHPMIDATAPEHVINPALYPRFSNLTQSQKRAVANHVEKERYNNEHR